MQLIVSQIQNLQQARFYNAYDRVSLAFAIDALSENPITVAQIKEICSWLHNPNICLLSSNFQDSHELLFLAEEIGAHSVICNAMQAKSLHYPHIINTEDFLVEKNTFTQALLYMGIPKNTATDFPYFLPYSSNIILDSHYNCVGAFTSALQHDLGDDTWLDFLESL